MKSPNQAQTSVSQSETSASVETTRRVGPDQTRRDQTVPDGTVRRNVNISTFLGSAVCSLLLLWVDGDKEEIIMLSHGSVLSAGVESSALTPVIINQEISTLSNNRLDQYSSSNQRP